MPDECTRRTFLIRSRVGLTERLTNDYEDEANDGKRDQKANGHLAKVEELTMLAVWIRTFDSKFKRGREEVV